MNKYAVFEQLEVLKNVKHRLYALAEMPDVPVGAATQLKLEAKCISWAYEELRTKHLVRCALLLGDEAFGPYSPPKHSTEYDEFLFSTCLVEPEQVALEKIQELFSAPEWEGNKLEANKTPPFLVCDRFFACRDENGKRLIFFDVMLHRDWLREKGTKEAKKEIDVWLRSMFEAMDWNQAKPLKS